MTVFWRACPQVLAAGVQCTSSAFGDEPRKMATAFFAETLDTFQLSTRLIPESRSCPLPSGVLRRVVSEDSLHNRRRENMKSHLREVRLRLVRTSGKIPTMPKVKAAITSDYTSHWSNMLSTHYEKFSRKT
jgi:hypothetical protein